MNNELHTILDFRSCWELKEKNGSKFGFIELKTLGEKSVDIFKSNVLANCRIYLKHWKDEDKYFSQVVIQEHDYYTLGDPHLSKVPIYQNEINRDIYLKEIILKKFKHLDIKIIDKFLLDIYKYCQNENVQKKLFHKDKINDSSGVKVNKVQLAYPTGHLKCFNDLFEATGLIGDEYKPILKSVWYCLLSTLIAQKQLEQGAILVDGRINLMISLPSGSGKTEIKKTMKQILEKVGKDYVEPTSFHPEQFVGKVIPSKPNKDIERNFIKVPGYLSLDFLMIDEGKDLLTSKESNYSESRKYLRLALDQYPHNTITKKGVDIEQKNALSYEPSCCVCILVQPFHLQEEIVLAGDFRRFIISYIPMLRADKTESYKNRIRSKRNCTDSISKFYNFLNLITIPENFELTENAIDLFENLAILLINRGSNLTPKVKNFVDIMDHTIINMLLKFCTIQALQDSKNLIEPRHVEFAFVDYAEILEHTYDFIENKILGSLDYGEKWGGAVKEDQRDFKMA